MKLTKYHLVIIVTIGGLFFAAAMHAPRALALSDSSSAPADSSSTTTSADPTTTDPTTDADTTDPTTTDPTAADPTTTTTDPTTDSSDSTTTDPSTTSTTPVCPTPDPSTDTTDDPTTTANPATTDPTSDDSSDTATTTNNTDVDNCVAADATSGNAGVSDSSSAGNATTGPASDTANLVNEVGSSADSTGAPTQTFTDNVNGDVNGDIELDPTDFLSSSGAATDAPILLNLNTANSTTLNNYVDLTANSGDATDEDNIDGGDATSGDATTEANIINLIDSMISDNQSFLGIVNIYGDLDGNILIPQQLVDELLDDPSLASSLVPGSATVDQTNNTDINNQITLAAQSGDATESDNHDSGNATTGTATTNLNVDNLVGNQIVGGNAFLVLVNVLGTWEGLILNEAPGSTSALLGGQITGYAATPGSATINNTNTTTINNIINVSSISGNATVSGNRFGGNATTGNATSSVNLVNIVNSDIDLSGWLGILIINVFGTWDGNLGIQMSPATVTTASAVVPPASTPTPKAKVFVYAFYPTQQSGPVSLSLASDVTTTPIFTNHLSPASDKTVSDNIKGNSFNYELIIGLSLLLSIVTFYLTRRVEQNKP